MWRLKALFLILVCSSFAAISRAQTSVVAIQDSAAILSQILSENVGLTDASDERYLLTYDLHGNNFKLNVFLAGGRTETHTFNLTDLNPHRVQMTSNEARDHMGIQLHTVGGYPRIYSEFEESGVTTFKHNNKVHIGYWPKAKASAEATRIHQLWMWLIRSQHERKLTQRQVMAETIELTLDSVSIGTFKQSTLNYEHKKTEPLSGKLKIEQGKSITITNEKGKTKRWEVTKVETESGTNNVLLHTGEGNSSKIWRLSPEGKHLRCRGVKTETLYTTKPQ